MLSYLKFQVSYKTRPEDTVRIVGNIKGLGEWNPEKALNLQTNSQIYPEWTHDTFIEIPFGTVIEFKCVLFHGEKISSWEALPFDSNRKYKTQYFKALLFMKEGQMHLIERPFQKYLGNHDCDIIDTTNAKKIQEKFIIFDPLRKADGLSSSSDNSSIEFFRRLSSSKHSEDAEICKSGDEKSREESPSSSSSSSSSSSVSFSNSSSSDEQGKSQDGKKKLLVQPNQTQPEEDGVEKSENQKKGEQPQETTSIGVLEMKEKSSIEKRSHKLSFTRSSLAKIEGKVPSHLASICLLFNRILSEAQTRQSKQPAIKKIVDRSDLLTLGNQVNQSNQNNVTSKQKKKNNNKQGQPLPIKAAHSMPLISQQLNEATQQTLVIVSCRLPFFVKAKRRRNSAQTGGNILQGQISSLYEFIENTDPVICSLYESLVNVKLNVIWLGICNIFVQSPVEQQELREYMVSKYSCYPLFVEEKTYEAFARQFCGKLLYTQGDSQSCFYEEDTSWKVYKEVNVEVACALKTITLDFSPIFAVAIYDIHFLLVPSLFLKQTTTTTTSATATTTTTTTAGQTLVSFQHFDPTVKLTLAFFTNRKFPAVQNLEALPQAQLLMHSLLFCDIMTFATYEAAEPFLAFAQNMGCTMLLKSGGKTVLQCNGREIQIRIAHPGINITKLEETRNAISEECRRRLQVLLEQRKHLVIGIDCLSRNSGLELKFSAFAKFLRREKIARPKSEYKLKQLVYFSSDSEFSTRADQLDYLDELRALTRSINQSQSFYDSAIELIEAETLTYSEYYSYITLSDCFFSTTLIETRHFHYMEYLFLKRDGQVVLSHCLPSISQFNAMHIVNPQDQQRLAFTLSLIFQNQANSSGSSSCNVNDNSRVNNVNSNSINTNVNNSTQSIQQTKLINNPASSVIIPSGVKNISLLCNTSSQPSSSSSASLEGTLSIPNTQPRASKDQSSSIKIQIAERNSTSEEAQREFDYNYLRRFCSSQQWIRHLIGDIVKRQAAQQNTAGFRTTEVKTIIVDAVRGISHHEEVGKMYERIASQHVNINLQNLVYKSKHATNAVFVFGFSSVFFDHTTRLLAEPKPNSLLFKQISDLASRPNNSVYIVSGKSPELLRKYLAHIPNITLFTQNGLRVQLTGRDAEPILLKTASQGSSSTDPAFWKMCVATRVEDFVQKTPGSYITESEIATTWHYENVEREFAYVQREELVNTLLPVVQTMPGYEIFQGYDFVQVRPECLNKGVMTRIALQNSYLNRGKIDLLVVVGGRKTTDEEMLKSAREIIHDDKIDYIDKHAIIILGSISQQLGALYCNHHFESNQDLAVLLELINGNKSLLKSDQIWRETEFPVSGIGAGNGTVIGSSNDNDNSNVNGNSYGIGIGVGIMTSTGTSISTGNVLSQQYPEQSSTLMLRSCTPDCREPKILKISDQQLPLNIAETAEPSPVVLEDLSLEAQKSSSSQQSMSQTEDLLQKRQKTKAFDFKLPFVNITHSLNHITDSIS